MRDWVVQIGKWSTTVTARTYGAACHKAFRLAISEGAIKKRPPADGYGGWRRVRAR